MKKYQVFSILIGFMFCLTGFNVHAQTSIYTTKSCTTKVDFANLTVEIRNYKDVKNFADYSCKGEIVVLEGMRIIEQKTFNKIAQEGKFGLFLHHDVLPNHVLVTKFGDLNDQLIVVNREGRTFTLNGSQIFVDSIRQLLFVLNYAEKGEISIFDLVTDKMVVHFTNLELLPDLIFREGDQYWVRFANFNNSRKTHYRIDLEKSELTKVKIKRNGLYLYIQSLQNSKTSDFKCQCECENSQILKP